MEEKQLASELFQRDELPVFYHLEMGKWPSKVVMLIQENVHCTTEKHAFNQQKNDVYPTQTVK